MDSLRWRKLLKAIRGDLDDLQIALIVDSPWIPDFADISHMEYYLEFDKWFESNISLYEKFEDIIFVPGFWVEYGMSAEVSSFGSRITWSEDSLPTPHPVIREPQKLEEISCPDPSKDGLMPFITHNYKRVNKMIKDKDFKVKMVAARGPLAVASWARGVTPFIKDVKKHPERTKKFLEVTTDLIVGWLEEQQKALSDVEGILLLDDIVGFLSPEDFSEFARPYLARIFDHFDDHVRIFHNDTSNYGILSNLSELNFEAFNFSHQIDINKVRDEIGEEICLMGNIPPLDVLARGTPEQVRNETKKLISKIEKDSRVLLSAGGGVAPETPIENINALYQAVREYNTGN